LNYRKKTILLIAISTIARLLIASFFELGNDEVYYWTYAEHPDWSYFDHPPMVGWLIRLSTANLVLQSALFVRLGAVVAAAIGTWLIFKLGTIVKDQRTGWFAALLYTASVYSCIIAGTFILPDSPQMIFWLGGILLLIKISNENNNTSKQFLLWCWFGLVTGLCIMCKVHGVFLWIGAFLYALFINPQSLKRKSIYVSAFITLMVISPLIIWNIQNHFITYTFHGNRVSLEGASIQPDGFAREIFGEIFYNNPINFFLICTGVFAAVKGKLAVEKKYFLIVVFCSVPLIVVLLFLSMFRDTLPHWSGPAYSCLLLLPAIKLASFTEKKILGVPLVVKAGIGFIIILAFAGVIVINFYPGTLSPNEQGLHLGEGDVTLDMYGWKDAGKKFDSLYREDLLKNIMAEGAPIIVTKWFPAAHIDFYLAAKTKQQTIGVGPVVDLHQYYLSNKYKVQLKPGDAAYLVVPSNLYDQQVLNELDKSFESRDSLVSIPLFRSGALCKYLYVTRYRGFRKRLSS
jgi:hypothetical protein